MTEPHNTKWLSYQQASEWAQSQNIMTCDQWNERCAIGLPEGVPADPETVYGEDFVGWHKFLGVQLSRDGRKVFWGYERVRDWARSAGVRTGAQWKQMSKDGLLPVGVPAQPYKVYIGRFVDWGEFLGTGHVATKDKTFVAYEEAKNWARSLDVKNMIEWKERRKEFGSEGIPAHPHRVYKEFTNWGEFLGTGRIANRDREFLSYDEASTWAQEEGISSREEWYQRSKIGFPSNIPVSPEEVYKGCFEYWSKFLGTNRSPRKIYSSINGKIDEIWDYGQVSAWAKNEGILSSTQWAERCKLDLPDGIPRRPQAVYEEFKDWSDFLGIPQIQGTSKVERVIRFVLEDIFEDPYTKTCNPIAYDNNNKKHKVDVLLSKIGIILEYDGSYWHKDKEEYDKQKSLLLRDSQFKVIRIRVKPLNILDREWDLSIDGDEDYPNQIWHINNHLLNLNAEKKLNFSKKILENFKKWDFDKLLKTNFREILEKYDGYGSYQDASEYAQKMGILNKKQWHKNYMNCSMFNFPSSPDQVYKHEFKTWGEFLGTGIISSRSRKFASYKEASEWVRGEGVKNSTEWRERCKLGLPSNIPSNPRLAYGDEFKDNNGWFGFLGKEKQEVKSKRKRKI